jgi:hypothetical protein
MDDEVLIMRLFSARLFGGYRRQFSFGVALLACTLAYPRGASAEPSRVARADSSSCEDEHDQDWDSDGELDSTCDDDDHGGSADVTVQVKPNGLVDVQQFGGSVRVTTWAQNAIHVKGSFSPDCRVDLTPSGDRETIRLACHHGPGVGDLEIQIPQTSALDVRGMSTDVATRDVGGAVRVQTVSGDIEVRGGAPSEIDVRSTSGSVTIAATSSSTRAQSISGDVEISGVRGRATLRTVSGTCKLTGGDFTAVEAESVSGDISFRGALSGQGKFEMNSHSGDITLHLPRTTGADVEMRTTSGDLVIDMGSGRKTAERELDARIGPGGAKLRLRSFSGDVRVLE